MTKRVRTGQARVEFLANRTQIHKLLSKGHTAVTVFEKLRDSGKITHAYTTFVALLRNDKEKFESVVEEPQSSACGDEDKNKSGLNNSYKNSFVLTEKTKQEKF